MRKIDGEASSIYGIPGIVLMENAAIKVVKHVAMLDGIGNKKVCIICGRGNNGGDGFAAARHLVSISDSVTIYFIGKEERLKGDAFINYNIAKNMGLNEEELLYNYPFLQENQLTFSLC
jgi:NAD(P)H-hydrate epimerase